MRMLSGKGRRDERANGVQNSGPRIKRTDNKTFGGSANEVVHCYNLIRYAS
jgi:hypothetical protein